MKNKKLSKILLDFIQGCLMIHVLWYLAAIIMKTPVIPSPEKVYILLPKLIEDKVLMHIGYSLYRIAAGLFLALVIGIPLGIGMARSQKMNRILYPFVYFTYPIPKTALLPIAMLLLGMRDNSKISIIFLIIVFQVIIAVRDSVYGIDTTMYHIVQSLGAKKIDEILHVIFPGIFKSVLTSIRISLGTALSILFFVESYGTKYGMGYFIVDAWSRIQYSQMYLGILIISFVGFLLFALMDILEHYFCPWDNSSSL